MAMQEAVILRDRKTPEWRVAGMTTLERLIMDLHRLGFDKAIIVSPLPLNLPSRIRDCGMTLEIVGEAPRTEDPCFVLDSRCWLDPSELARLWKQSNGALLEAKGERVPLGWLKLKGTFPEFDSNQAGADLNAGAIPVVDAESARLAERSLWRSMASSSDGIVDVWFNRPLGRFLFSRHLVKTPITPNQVTAIATLIGLAAAALFAQGHYAFQIAGALLFQLSAIVDCVDGDVARAMYKESKSGKWLDLYGDQAVHAGVFLGVAYGLWRAGADVPALWLGWIAFAGALLSFLVILRGEAREDMASDHRFQKWIDAATNRDFSVVVLALAVAGQLEWFLWMAAVGSHAFWLLALGLQIRRGNRRDSVEVRRSGDL